jgi:hypothetical protein
LCVDVVQQISKYSVLVIRYGNIIFKLRPRVSTKIYFLLFFIFFGAQLFSFRMSLISFSPENGTMIIEVPGKAQGDQVVQQHSRGKGGKGLGKPGAKRRTIQFRWVSQIRRDTSQQTVLLLMCKLISFLNFSKMASNIARYYSCSCRAK